MRVLISVLCLAFAIGGTAWASCGSNSHGKKNDFETPPPIVLQTNEVEQIKK